MLVSLLSGCALGPKFVKPKEPVNDTWIRSGDLRVAAQNPVDAAWWKGFGDPALDRLVQSAYHQNLSLQIAGLRIMEARAQLKIAVGRQYPQVQAALANASVTGISQHAADALGFDERNFGDYQIGFDVQWELDFWHKYGRGVHAASATYFASVADYDTAVTALVAEVARSYAVLRTFEVLADLARENATLQEDGLRIARARFTNGATSELDVAQAITLLESTRATIPQLQASVEQTRNALATLLGQTPGSIQALLEGPKAIPVAPAEVAIGAPADMLRRRPDVRSAELLAEAQCDRVGIAKAEQYPMFTLLGSLGFRTATLHSNTPPLLSRASIFYSLGVSIFQPIFNYGRLKNNVRVEDARLQQQLVAYQDTVLRAAQEVEDSLAGLFGQQQAALSEQKAVDGAKRAVEIAFLQYREGAVDFQRVLDAQRSLLQEQNALAQTRSAIATNYISLYKALGGGWQAWSNQPFIPDAMRQEMQNRTNWGDLLSQPTESETSKTSTSAR
jgi:NodT family efflux transporter outer membrane factor (OMF) lipoprotein